MRERLSCCDKEAFLAAATELPGLMHCPAAGPHAFPGTTYPRQRGSSRPPSQVPNNPGKEKSLRLTGLAPITFRARLTALCSHCSAEEVPSLSVREGGGDVVGVLTPLVGGVAQAFHDDRVVELRVQLGVQEVEGKRQGGTGGSRKGEASQRGCAMDDMEMVVK